MTAGPTTSPPRSATHFRRRAPIMLLGLISLLAALWGGLLLLGLPLPTLRDTTAADHGPLMTLGFLGTVIALERAVALRRWWAFGAPMLAGLGGLALIVGAPGYVGWLLLCLASMVLLGVYAVVLAIDAALHLQTMAAAAVCWYVATILWLGGQGIPSIVPWLAGFLILTVIGERLELARVALLGRMSVRVFRLGAVIFLIGLLLSAIPGPVAPWGVRVAGLGLLVLAGWGAKYDVARRTVKIAGVTRFMAVCLLSGYAWLLVSGIAWLSVGDIGRSNAVYDLSLHAVFLGFVMSMIFGHAPVIVPAVLGMRLPFHRTFYAHLALLHAGLLVRLAGGDLVGSTVAWQAGGAATVAAILLFLVSSVVAVVRARFASRQGSDHAPRRAQAIVVTVALVVAAAGAFAVGNRWSGSTEAASGIPAQSAGTRTVHVVLDNMRITPSVITVRPGTHLLLDVTDTDTIRHDLAIDGGPRTPLLGHGQSARLDVGKITHAMQGWCTVPGHKAAGMTMSIQLAGTKATAAAPPSGSMDGMSMGSQQKTASIDPAAKPPAGFTARDPKLAAAPKGTVHHYTFTVRDVRTSVAPGVTQTLWTYNGTAPGPILHGKVGDTFVIRVVNHGDMTHNIDFHAGRVSPDREMREIDPGKSLTYTFRADHSGAWLYHCSTMPMALHVANGMYGAVVIDPPDLDKVSTELVMVQSELYLGAKGGIADVDKVNARTPDAFTFNGYVSQYADRPIHVRAGTRIRIWVVDAGPTFGTSFHVVGTQFDTVFKEGAYLLRRGNAEHGGSQALDLAPAQGGFVEFVLPAPGHYTFMDHSMVDAEKGAQGVLLAR